jgi:SIR2-like domain
VKLYAQNDADADEEPVECVFTEQQYYDFFSRPYGVFSYTFLYLLREFSCVFIGMSMQDENIRRLLHYSMTDRRGGKPVTPQTRPRHFALLPPTDSPRIDQFAALSLRRLGVRVLDVPFQDIPTRLADIYGPKEWKTVY